MKPSSAGYTDAVIGPRLLSRPLLAAAFIAGGVKTLRAPKTVTAAAETVGVPIAAKIGLPTNPEQLVTINAAVQVGAGVLLALGIAPRMCSLVLAGSLVPTTLAGHRFWEEDDADKKAAQRMQFMKNASMLGGLLANALDPAGRPTVFWSVRRAAGHAADSVSHAASFAVGSTQRTLGGLAH